MKAWALEMRPAMLVVASGTDDLIPDLIERARSIAPELPLYVFAEFRPAQGNWIPYHPARNWRDNFGCLRAGLRGQRVKYAAVLFQPGTPHWRMRLMGALLNPAGLLAFNENFDHWMLRPRCAGTIARHLLWRIRNFLRSGPRTAEKRPIPPRASPVATAGNPPRRRPVILVASPYVPWQLSHGGAVRMYNLMRRAAVDFDLALIAFTDSAAPAPQELLDLCTEVVLVQRTGSHLRTSGPRPHGVEEFDSPVFRAALREAVKKWKPAIAQLEYTQMAQYAADCAPAKTILVEHDITYSYFERLLELGEDWETRFQCTRWKRFERDAWRQVTAVVAVSERDRQIVNGARCELIPNGVDLEWYAPSDEEPEPGRLLFVAPFAHEPNRIAARYFLRDVWPLLDSARPMLHLIAGREGAAEIAGRPRVEVDEFVADLRTAYRRASVVIAPLLASAGTKIKILEAMAMGKAVVTTPDGKAGLSVLAGEDLLVAANAEEMAAAIQRLLRDPALRSLIGRQARETVEKRYGWDRIARKQKLLYQDLLRPRGN